MKKNETCKRATEWKQDRGDKKLQARINIQDKTDAMITFMDALIVTTPISALEVPFFNMRSCEQQIFLV